MYIYSLWKYVRMTRNKVSGNGKEFRNNVRVHYNQIVGRIHNHIKYPHNY